MQICFWIVRKHVLFMSPCSWLGIAVYPEPVLRELGTRWEYMLVGNPGGVRTPRIWKKPKHMKLHMLLICKRITQTGLTWTEHGTWGNKYTAESAPCIWALQWENTHLCVKFSNEPSWEITTWIRVMFSVISQLQHCRGLLTSSISSRAPT